MKEKDWFAKKFKSNDKPFAYRCFTTTTTPLVTKFVTTTTIDSNIDVKYVEPDCEKEKMKDDIDKLAKRVLTLENIVKLMSDDLTFLCY